MPIARSTTVTRRSDNVNLQASHNGPDDSGRYIFHVRDQGWNGQNHGQFILRKTESGKGWVASFKGEKVDVSSTASDAIRAGALAVRDRRNQEANEAAATPVTLLAIKGTVPAYALGLDRDTQVLVHQPGYHREDGVSLTVLALGDDELAHEVVEDIKAKLEDGDERFDASTVEYDTTTNIHAALDFLGLDADRVTQTLRVKAMLDTHVNTGARERHENAVANAFTRIQETLASLGGVDILKVNADLLTQVADLLDKVDIDSVDFKA